MDAEFPNGYYYAHVPSLGLTTHGLGIEGARRAAFDLVKLWIAEKEASGGQIIASTDICFSVIELSEEDLESA